VQGTRLDDDVDAVVGADFAVMFVDVSEFNAHGACPLVEK
jgi:hypothetical protein